MMNKKKKCLFSEEGFTAYFKNMMNKEEKWLFSENIGCFTAYFANVVKPMDNKKWDEGVCISFIEALRTVFGSVVIEQIMLIATSLENAMLKEGISEKNRVMVGERVRKIGSDFRELIEKNEEIKKLLLLNGV